MALPWQVVDSVETAEGLLELRRRGDDDYLITIANRVLMNSRANRSEIVLSELACAALGQRQRPRVLVAGLGMAYTLRAALDNLPEDAQVVVAELNPVVVDWCRGPLSHLTAGAVADPRVTVEISDVALVIAQAAMARDKAFDAIILDMYEGPYEADNLFGEAALHLAATALRPGGVFAVWSEDPDKGFEERLRQAGFTFTKQRPGRGGRRHVVYVAKGAAARPGAKKGGGRGAKSRRRRRN
ncbi:MAG: spermidine synthase [Thermodesulfobacteriota bacterium]